jgi:hypothetical protein
MKMNGGIHFWPQKLSPSPLHQQKCIIKVGGGYLWKKMANPTALPSILIGLWEKEEWSQRSQHKCILMLEEIGEMYGWPLKFVFGNRNWKQIYAKLWHFFSKRTPKNMSQNSYCWCPSI